MSGIKTIILVPPSIRDEGNYIEFIEQVQDDYCEEHGDVGLCLTTGVEFIPRAVLVIDYNPPIVVEENEVEPQAAVTPASVAKRRDAFTERRDKLISENKEKLKRMFKSLLKRCSQESRFKIKDHAGVLWEGAERTNDTIALIRWIKESHLTAVFGVSPALKALNQESLRKRMDILMQEENESVTDFGQKYKNLKKAFIGAGGPESSDIQETLHFLGKLNSHYEPLTREMANKAMRGDEHAYPLSLEATVYTVSNWIARVTAMTHQAFLAGELKKQLSSEKKTTEKGDKSEKAKYEKGKLNKISKQNKLILKQDKRLETF